MTSKPGGTFHGSQQTYTEPVNPGSSELLVFSGSVTCFFIVWAPNILVPLLQTPGTVPKLEVNTETLPIPRPYCSQGAENFHEFQAQKCCEAELQN